MKNWLSILIPTYNRLALLKQTIGSVLPQVQAGIQVVISDNGSIDGTREYLHSLKASNVKTLLRDGSGGFAGNVNDLVANSDGAYFILLHDDDMLSDGAIQIVKALIDQDIPNNSLIIGSLEILDESKAVAYKSVLKFENLVLDSNLAVDFFSKKWEIRAPSIYYNRLFARSPFYLEDFGIARDSKVLLDYMTSGNVIVTSNILGVYRQSGIAETVTTFYGDAWGESSLLFAKYIRGKYLAGKISLPATYRLTSVIYGSWLRKSARNSYDNKSYASLVEYVLAFFILKITGRPVSWKIRDRLSSLSVRVLTRGLGRFGKLSALYFFSNVKSPQCISRTAQLIGLSKIKVGSQTTIGQGSTLIASQSDDGAIKIDEQGYIGKNVYISGGKRVEIGPYSLVGANVQILGAGHMLDVFRPIRISKVVSYGEIKVGANVWIGNSAVLLGDVTIGYGSVVGAGAVVRNMNVPPFSVVAGNPAKLVKMYNFKNGVWESYDPAMAYDEISRGIPGLDEYLMILKENSVGITADLISFSVEGGYTA